LAEEARANSCGSRAEGECPLLADARLWPDCGAAHFAVRSIADAGFSTCAWLGEFNDGRPQCDTKKGEILVSGAAHWVRPVLSD
jgi:hypothetical protein